MKSNSSKSLVQFVIATIILVAVNAWVWMGVGNGSLSPVEHRALWVAFMVLNVASLLWAIRLLGLQPLVMACSYAAGGFLAYSGVNEVGDISVAEVTTAGATYGAIGALAVGNLGTKVRVAFVHKGQVPFIFVIIGLLVVDGILNSQISGAGWTVVLNALIFPFMLAGVVIGLGWAVVSRMGILPHARAQIKPMPGAVETAGEQAPEQESAADSSQLVIRMPGLDVEDEETDEPEPSLAMETEPLQREAVIAEEPVVELSVEAAVEEVPVETDNFFPLEIDKGEDLILPPDEEIPISTLDLDMEEHSDDITPESEGDLFPEAFETEAEPILEAAPEPEPTPEVEPEPAAEESVADSVEEPRAAEEKPASDDWLNGHLDLLNKIGKKE